MKSTDGWPDTASDTLGNLVYAYNPIDNVLTNGETGSGLYSYGAKPHAVTSANGKSYAYDACGNMITRGTQALTYDGENRLTQVSASGSPTVNFGYADGGARLWRYNGSSYTVWIGGIYEEKDGKVLCHVFAGGKRVATFEPLGGGRWAKAVGEEKWFAAVGALTRAMDWPFQQGRSIYSMLLVAFVGLLGVCVAARRAAFPSTTTRRPSFKWRPRPIWQHAVTFLSILALLVVTTPEVHAQSYNPVFYYYHGDHLGSSNVLTDRAGVLVQHYENTAWGKESHKNNTSAFSVSNRYTGQVLDEETGLYYYNARYYDPELGRFIQADTVVPGAMNPQNLNRYAYVSNNPLKYTDPSGHTGFFEGLGKAFSQAFSNPLSAIGAVMSGSGSVAQDYMWSQMFGAEAAYYHSIATGVIMALATIVIGVILCASGVGAPAGVFMIIQGVLSLASIGASMAGDQELSENLAWAALAVSIVGALVSAPEGEIVYPKNDSTNFADYDGQLGIAGMNQDAQYYANTRGYPFLSYSRGMPSDLFYAGLQKFSFGILDWKSIGMEKAIDKLNYSGPMKVKAHSQGAFYATRLMARGAFPRGTSVSLIGPGSNWFTSRFAAIIGGYKLTYTQVAGDWIGFVNFPNPNLWKNISAFAAPFVGFDRHMNSYQW